MKDLIHYEEWKNKGIEFCIVDEEALTTQRINVYWQKPTKAQAELYKYLKRKVDCGEKPHESEIFEIYTNHVKALNRLRFTDNPELDDERIHNNARQWFKQSLASLVLLGWFGLQFKKRINYD